MTSISKVSYIACAVAAALGTGAANAVVPTTTPGLVVYAGGGSAEPQPIEAAFCRNFTNVDLYTDNSASPNQSGSYLILYGTAGANAGVTAGTNVLFVYKFNGGSYANGAVPQAGAGGQLTYPTQTSILSAALIGAPSTQGTVCTAAQKGNPTYVYTPALSNNQQPSFGVTDLEVAAFSGDNNPSGALNSASIWVPAPLVSVPVAAPVYDLVEGVAVTNTLFAKKTNFSRAEVAAILSGQVTDWHNIYGDNGSPVAPAHTGVVLIDRNVGSGTKVAGSLYFLGYPALGSNQVIPNSVTNTAGTGNGTGNGALTNAPFNAGYNPSAGVPSAQPTVPFDIQEKSSATVVADLIAADQAGEFAIAVLSADNPQALSPTPGHYDFVKINNTAMDTFGQSVPAGIAGDNVNGTGSSYLNVINGSYEFFYQVNVNSRAALSGFPAAMVSAMTSPTLAGVNSGLQFPLATNGIVADADVNSTLAKGVTIVTRNGNSASTLKPALSQGLGTIVPGNDPL